MTTTILPSAPKTTSLETETLRFPSKSQGEHIHSEPLTQERKQERRKSKSSSPEEKVQDTLIQTWNGSVLDRNPELLRPILAVLGIKHPLKDLTVLIDLYSLEVKDPITLQSKPRHQYLVFFKKGAQTIGKVDFEVELDGSKNLIKTSLRVTYAENWQANKQRQK